MNPSQLDIDPYTEMRIRIGKRHTDDTTWIVDVSYRGHGLTHCEATDADVATVLRRAQLSLFTGRPLHDTAEVVP